MSSTLLLAALVGAGVFMIFVGLAVHLAALSWQARLHRNVGAFREDSFIGVARQAHVPQDELAQRLNARLRRLSFMPKLRMQLATAGISMPASRFLLIQIAVMAIGVLLAFIMLQGYGLLRYLGIFMGAGAGFYALKPFLSFRRRRRLGAVENQLPDTIDVLASALESGSSLPQSMAMVAREMSDPISTEFSRVARDQELGLSQQEALERMLQRCPSEDLDMLVTAINIQYRVGGNLSQILRTISHTIRERLRIKREIGILTAQGRISAKVVTAVPFGLTGIIFLLNKPYMSQLFMPGFPRAMVILALLMIGMGYYVMNRIVSIKV